MFLINKNQPKGVKHFYSGVPLGLSAKTKTNHDIFDLMISVCHWGNPVARTFARTHFATVCHAALDMSAKTETKYDIFDLVISVCHWEGPTLRQCAMLLWRKTGDLQGL